MKKILVTGCAGFIGSHLCERLLLEGNYVIGIDNLDPYYDITVKHRNLNILKQFGDNFIFIEECICETRAITTYKPHLVIHLAAKAGVRASLEDPERYARVNILGFVHILEECRQAGVKRIIYASSSSVYGLNNTVPFSETDSIEKCNSPYAASKRAMEIYAQTYSQLYQLETIGLRFFTVYGPRGRPDMAPYKFVKSIKEGKEIVQYGDGLSMRDYTYISDIIDGITSVIRLETISQGSKFKVYNLGNSSPITLLEFIKACETAVGRKAIVRIIENQQGDVPRTFADISLATRELGYNPKVPLAEGLKSLVEYLKVNNC